jgi:hypothetical protein
LLTALIVTVCVAAALVLALVGAVAWLANGSSLRGALKERVLVTLKSGEGFDGVLLRVDRRSWELVNATAIGAGERGADVPVNGSLIVPAENVAYAQKP